MNAIQITDRAARVLTPLTQALGSASVLVDRQLEGRTLADWSGMPSCPPVALLLPRTPDEVALALRICHEHRQPVVVQGGLTGLAGGANPGKGEIALSLARLKAIEAIDDIGGTVVVQAGVTLEELQTAVEAKGWEFPLDLGARGSCQLGGNAATNAGGNMVLRHGSMRQLVLGVEVALADGRLLTMLDRVVKNNAGFDLKQLFIGSEGLLGVVTRLSLKLEPRRDARCTVLCGLRDLPASASLLRMARARLADLSAFELMWPDFFSAAERALERTGPFSSAQGLYALLETRSNDAASAQGALEAFMAEALEQGLVQDAVLAQSLDQTAQLWAFRESVSELLAMAKPCAAFDVSVPMPDMDALVGQLRAELSALYPLSMHLFFGHLGDGNLHLLSGPHHDAAQLLAVEALVYRAVGRFGGSISAEHGIGLSKRDFLHLSRSEPELQAMAQLKALFDPNGILNPGRVFAA